MAGCDRRGGESWGLACEVQLMHWQDEALQLCSVGHASDTSCWLLLVTLLLAFLAAVTSTQKLRTTNLGAD
jgi:hypothetical protein